MRTRLDEIVEEETREACPGAGAPRGGYLHRIAERAFREGAAECALAVWRGEDVLNWPGRVQPAQAKEKCLCGPVPHAPHEPPYHIRQDARKNERRMGNEALNFVHGPTRPETRQIYQVNDHGSWQYERRSGDDRRGAKF